MNYAIDGKIVGKLENGVFSKSVSRRKHLFRLANGWGIQYQILKDLPDETVIEIYDKDDRKMYRTTKKDYWSKGKLINLGHGEQVVLDRGHFTYA